MDPNDIFAGIPGVIKLPGKEDPNYDPGLTVIENEWRRQIRLMEEVGSIDPNCVACKKFYNAERPIDVFAPRHTAAPNCESGKHSHCTCDACF